jgi:hypothetical protein
MVDGGCAPPSVLCGATCTDIRSDNQHCGGCPTACTPDLTCVSGMCLSACSAGQVRCGASLTCTSVLSDPSNCGDCGTACPAGQICSSGTCMIGAYTHYTESSPTTAFVDACTIAGHTTVLTTVDDSTSSITLPFTFGFYDYRGTAAWVSSNGVAGFGSTPSISYSNSCLPSTGAPLNALFAFWDDLKTRATGVCYGTLGSAPNRVEVITWSDAQTLADASSHLTFSVILTETSNTIDVVYQTLSGTNSSGQSATIGVQNTAGTIATQHSCDSPSLSSGAAIHYTPM